MSTSKNVCGRYCGWISCLFRFQFVALRCVFLVRALAVLGALLAVFLATAMMFGAFGAASRVPPWYMLSLLLSPGLDLCPELFEEGFGPGPQLLRHGGFSERDRDVGGEIARL